jgi:hypothetical protein
MSISFDLTQVTSNKAARLFDEFPEQARAELEKTIGELTQQLAASVIAAEPKRTGQLQAATVDGVFTDSNKIIGRVSIKGPSGSAIFAKAAALEYGAHQSTRVRAYSRTVSAVYGRAIAPSVAVVRAYDRTPDIAAGMFLRAPLAALQGAAAAAIQDALDRAAKKTEASS